MTQRPAFSTGLKDDPDLSGVRNVQNVICNHLAQEEPRKCQLKREDVQGGQTQVPKSSDEDSGAGVSKAPDRSLPGCETTKGSAKKRAVSEDQTDVCDAAGTGKPKTQSLFILFFWRGSLFNGDIR